jgi:hypothetical protein
LWHKPKGGHGSGQGRVLAIFAPAPVP